MSEELEIVGEWLQSLCTGLFGGLLGGLLFWMLPQSQMNVTTALMILIIVVIIAVLFCLNVVVQIRLHKSKKN
jgi:predicted lipid-binding transport protein (Tim44 family)